MRVALRVALAVLVLALVLVLAVVIHVHRTVAAVHEVPLPVIVADTSPAAVARGADLFQVGCTDCHVPPGGRRASGAPFPGFPAELGSVHAANLTRHPEAGIGALSDAHVARMVRTGVDRRGRMTLMPGVPMSDRDLAALLGYLRSEASLFQADPTVQPKTELTLKGKVALVMSDALTPPARAISIPHPEERASVEFGRYLAFGRYDCGGCHTAGFASQRAEGPDAFTGGFAFPAPDGSVVFSANLTPHANGLEGWSQQDLAVALRDGLRPGGTAVRPPMPRYRGMEDVEIEALHLYLSHLPAADHAVPGRIPAGPPVTAAAAKAPEELFLGLGCAGCHGPGAFYHPQMEAAAGKDPVELAVWIRHPESFKPGTAMPTYADALDAATARRLAEWIRDGGPLAGTATAVAGAPGSPAPQPGA